MIKLIIKALKRFAWFRRINAKVTYEFLANRIPGSEWQFMNYGYAPGAAEKRIEIVGDGKVQLYPLQMYHYLAMKTSIEGKHPFYRQTIQYIL